MNRARKPHLGHPDVRKLATMIDPGMIARLASRNPITRPQGDLPVAPLLKPTNIVED